MIQVYHGDGKGKTTAAVGLAVRAAGAGIPVLFCQFMKGGETAELNSLEKLDLVRVFRCSLDFPFLNQMTDIDKNEITKEHNSILMLVQDELNKILKSVESTQEKASMDIALKDKKIKAIVIWDEVTYPMNYDLIDKDFLYEILDFYNDFVEFVCTGRNPETKLLDMADYISEVKCRKHPFDRGITARYGIEY